MSNAAQFLGVGTDVQTQAAGALGGDGTLLNPLGVNVDGVTVTVNGSNELVAAGGGSNGVRTFTRDFANAEILALPTTPLELIEAPGANQVILPVMGAGNNFIYFDTSADALTNWESMEEYVSLTLMLGTVDVSGAIANAYIYRNTINRALAIDAAVSLVDDGAPGDLTATINQPLVMSVPDQTTDFTGGSDDNIYRLRFSYIIVNALTGAVVLD